MSGKLDVWISRSGFPEEYDSGSQISRGGSRLSVNVNEGH